MAEQRYARVIVDVANAEVDHVFDYIVPEGMALDAEAGVVRWVESAEDGRSLVCAAALAPAGEFPRLDWLEHRLVTELNASPEE